MGLGQWISTHALPQGSFRRRLARKGYHLLRDGLIEPVRARAGGWAAFVCPPLELFQPDLLNKVLQECGLAPLAWSPHAAETGELGAARLALGAFQQRADLRGQFSQGICAGREGGYCRWLCTAGAREFGLSSTAVGNLEAAFGRQLGHRPRHLHDKSILLRHLIPLALMPAGQRQFLRWLLWRGRSLVDLADEEIWWFLFECAGDPYRGVAATYLQNPSWQQRFPCGLTVFGQKEFLAWLAAHYQIQDDWLKQVDLAGFYPPLDQVRLLYAATPALQELAPRAFRSPEGTASLVRWLHTEGSTLASLTDCWWEELEVALFKGLAEKRGVNHLGHFCFPSGLREAAHGTVHSLEIAGVAASCRDVPGPRLDDLAGRSAYLGLELFDATLIQVAPGLSLDYYYPMAGLAQRPGVYRIAVWYWELEAVPRLWAGHARALQEIWAPTQFIARAMRRIMPIPVYDMLPGVRLGTVPRLPRSHFGLPEDRLLFLFMFDMGSVMKRKNPLAVIRAFRQAFRSDAPVALALKVSRGQFDKENFARLRRAADEAGVMVIDGIMSREESYGLMNTCDCYVSLHRSEGFGLTMAEAMLLGKPVIATAYSGNLDFMSPANSLLVDYTRVPITQDLPFYRKGCVWAEPSVEQAAQHMRWVFEHPDQARDLGTHARAEVSRLLSPEAAGQRMARRLQAIGRGGKALCQTADLVSSKSA